MVTEAVVAVSVTLLMFSFVVVAIAALLVLQHVARELVRRGRRLTA